MDVVLWLRSLGLGKYEAAFREDEIDETVLPNLTAEDLKDLGVSIVGHRRKFLDAIAALHTDTGVQLQTRKWQDQSGQDRYSTEVVLQGFRGALTLLDRGAGPGAGDVMPDTGDRSHSADPTPQATTAGVRRSSADMDDEIPC